MKAPPLNLHQDGQTLLEITIAIGIAVLVISALTVTTLVGLRNSQFSQNQIQATKFAQEGLEQIRSFRDRNTPLCSNISSSNIPYYWNKADTNKTPYLWDTQFSTARDFYLAADGVACKITDNIGLWNENPKANTIFSRKVLMVDNLGSLGQKRLTVEVSWTDSTGTHKSELSTILSNH